MKKSNNKKKGITLVTLVLTILIMLVLAGLAIGAINGGLFDYTKKATTSTQESVITEKISKAFTLAQGESPTNIVTEEALQKQINKMFPDENVDIQKEGDGFVLVRKNVYYQIRENGSVESSQNYEQKEYAGDITKGGTCTGTQSKPYRIECIEDLVKLAELTNKKSSIITTSKYYELVNDLDFNSIFSYSNYQAKYVYNSEADCYEPDPTGNSTTTIKELCTTGQGFIPIGLVYSNRFFITNI